MTTVENQPPQSSTADDIYDSDDYGKRDTPPLKPMKINLQPSPSPPPAVPLPQVSPEPSPEPPGRKGSNRPKNRPSQGDAVLVSFMDGGKNPDIARYAGNQPLASDDEGDGSVKGVEVEVTAVKEDLDLPALAANALRAHEEGTSQPTPKPNTIKDGSPNRDAPPSEPDQMEGVKPTIPSITATYVGDPRPRSSPDTAVKLEIKASPTGELPPIRQHSPKSALSNSNGAGPITLPSISDQLGDLNHLADAAATGDSSFSQSPPARPPPRFSAIPSQGSPPKSPIDAFRRELPSPGRGAGHYYYNANSHRRPSQTEGPQYSSAGDYSSSNTETPSTDQSCSTPAMAIDRMSIDGITNPQIGGFQCNYPGCTAQPFQTQVSQRSLLATNLPHVKF
jgi:hypothetical protein